MSVPGWEGILDKDETILWQGRPDGRFHVGGKGIAGGVFGLFFAARIKKLSEECQKMLKLVADGHKPEEIKEYMNYKSIGYTYKRRRVCKERLIKLIRNDIDYKNT